MGLNNRSLPVARPRVNQKFEAIEIQAPGMGRPSSKGPIAYRPQNHCHMAQKAPEHTEESLNSPTQMLKLEHSYLANIAAAKAVHRGLHS